MSDAPRFPLYYLPPGLARPGHIVHQGGIRVVEDIGPMDAAPGERGGTIIGGAWDDRTLPLWKKTQAGWWVAMGGATPVQVARLVPIDGALVPGKDPSQSWLVPRLLRWRDGHGLVSAVPNEFRDYQWQAPAHLEPLMLKLRCMFYWQAEGEVPEVPDAEAVQLAADLLGLNYHITLDELTVAGWITDRLVLDILSTAVGLDYAGG